MAFASLVLLACAAPLAGPKADVDLAYRLPIAQLTVGSSFPLAAIIAPRAPIDHLEVDLVSSTPCVHIVPAQQVLEHLVPPQEIASTPGQPPALPALPQRGFTLLGTCAAKATLTLTAHHDNQQVSREIALEVIAK